LNTRNWREEKVDENVSAEILGICTQESYESYGDKVQEIETCDKSISELKNEIIKIIQGEINYPLGQIDYLGEYFYML